MNISEISRPIANFSTHHENGNGEKSQNGALSGTKKGLSESHLDYTGGIMGNGVIKAKVLPNGSEKRIRDVKLDPFNLILFCAELAIQQRK